MKGKALRSLKIIFVAGAIICAALTLVRAQRLFQTRLVPVAEGWAKNQINAVIFRKNSIASHGRHQYVAFYDGEGKVVVGKRRLGSKSWEIKRTGFSGDTNDAHNSISLAADGAGFLHLAWNHHNVPLQYSRSLKPETLEFSEKMPMTGADENRLSYPEFYNLPGGDLLFLYRDGASGNGRLVLNRYETRAKRWTRVQTNLIDGEGKRSAYPQLAVDRRGAIHLSWVWRESPDVASNHDLAYAVSTDGGRSWRQSGGEIYRLPITTANAEYAWKIPPGSELINQTSMTADEAGRPLIATYWRDAGSPVPQYRLVYFDGEKWRASQVSQRKEKFSLSGAGTKRIPVSRPQVLATGKGNERKILFIFRDAERGSRISAAICGKLETSACRVEDLAEADFGLWEPSFDQELWRSTGELHLFAQKVGQGDGERLEELPPQMVSVLEVKLRKF